MAESLGSQDEPNTGESSPVPPNEDFDQEKGEFDEEPTERSTLNIEVEHIGKLRADVPLKQMSFVVIRIAAVIAVVALGVIREQSMPPMSDVSASVLFVVQVLTILCLALAPPRR